MTRKMGAQASGVRMGTAWDATKWGHWGRAEDPVCRQISERRKSLVVKTLTPEIILFYHMNKPVAIPDRTTLSTCRKML